jgi:hypothetical protein
MAMGNGPFIDGLPIKNGSYINISTSAPRKFFPPRCAPWVTTAGSRSPPRRASRCRCRPRTVRRPPTCRRMRRRGSRGWVGWLKVRTAVKVGFFDIPNSSNPHEITMKSPWFLALQHLSRRRNGGHQQFCRVKVPIPRSPRGAENVGSGLQGYVDGSNPKT